MDRRKVLSLPALVAFGLALASGEAASQPFGDQIVGLWKLTSNTTKNVATGAMEKLAGEHPLGYQLFTKSEHMMFIQTAENRKPPAGTTATDAERVAWFKTLVAYAGSYKVEGAKVLIHFETNATPGIPDRSYTPEISGKKLTLTADPFVNANGQRIVSIRTFERVD
jgi:hypothetical protein